MDNSIPNLRDFAEKLIEEKGVTSIDPEVKEQLIQDIVKRAEDLINRRLLEQLTQEELNAFELLLEQHATQDQIQTFLRERVSNINQVIAGALLELRQAYLG